MMTGSVSQRPRRKPKADFEGPPPYELKKNETLYEISRNMQLSRWLDKDMESQVRFAARQIVQAFCLDKTVWERIGPERKANALQALKDAIPEMPHTKEDWLALCVLMSIARNRKNNHRMKRASASFYMDTESRHSYDSVHRLSDGFSAPVSTIILPSDDSPQMLSPSSSTRSLDRIAVENLLCNTC